MLTKYWMYALICAFVLPGNYAYFGLTGKTQIRDVKPIDHEAVFMAGDEQDDVYVWNENGYYTAPSNGYERIDLSPKPDTDPPSSRGQRSKKNVDQHKPSLAIEETAKADDVTQHIGSSKQPLSTQKKTPHQRPNPSYTRRHAGPYPGYHARYPRMPQYPRRPYPVQQFRYPPGMYRYGRDGIRMVSPPYSSRGPTAGQAFRMYGQAISTPIQSVNIDDIRSRPVYTGPQNARGLNRFATAGDRPHTVKQPHRDHIRTQTQSDEADASLIAGIVAHDKHKRLEHGKRRHLSAKVSPTVHSVLSGKKLLEKEKGITNKPTISVANRETSPTSSIIPGQTEIKPLFVGDDISSIMTFMGVDDSGHAYVSLNEELDSQSFSSALRSDAGSRATDLPSMVPSSDINRKESRRKCDDILLSRKQRKMCKRDPGIPQVLHEATATSVAECQHQFRFERWNCSTGSTRIHLLSKGNRETAFLFAISSAGLTHSVARACAEGYLERCSCDETYSDHVNQEAWMWGGCGDNVHSASKFVRQFLKPKSRSRDIRSEVDKHNSDMGIRLVRQSVQNTCKCHGVSGSCTTKTCWRKVAPFYKIGQKIKEAYDRSVKVGGVNSADGKPKLIRLRRTRRNRPEIRPTPTGPKNTTTPSSTQVRLSKPSMIVFEKPTPVLTVNGSKSERQRQKLDRRRIDINKIQQNPRSSELVYLENSPQYCRRTRYSLGTKGRLCDKEENCDKICCGRGYTTHIRIVRRSCECEVRWCCYVKCKTCTERREIHTCK